MKKEIERKKTSLFPKTIKERCQVGGPFELQIPIASSNLKNQREILESKQTMLPLPIYKNEAKQVKVKQSKELQKLTESCVQHISGKLIINQHQPNTLICIRIYRKMKHSSETSGFSMDSFGG